jgi:hypothetical protein
MGGLLIGCEEVWFTFQSHGNAGFICLGLLRGCVCIFVGTSAFQPLPDEFQRGADDGETLKQLYASRISYCNNFICSHCVHVLCIVMYLYLFSSGPRASHFQSVPS